MASGQVSDSAPTVGGRAAVPYVHPNLFSVFRADDPYSSAEPHVSGVKR